MRKIVLLECIIVSLLIIGCSHIPFVGKIQQSSESTAQSNGSEERQLEPNKFVEKGRIINTEALQKGKNIAIIPFTAGVSVEASNGLDKVALMIIKGISDAFADDHSGKHDHFNILTAENSEAADLIVQGHINSLKSPSKVKKWVLISGQKMLGVDGKIVDARTGESVLIFEDTQETSVKEEIGRAHV